MSAVLANEGFFKCNEYDRYAELLKHIKWDDKLVVEPNKITLMLKWETQSLPHLCNCKYSHFINHDEAYSFDLSNKMSYLRKVMGDEQLSAWGKARQVNLGHRGSYWNDLDEICNMGSAFFCEVGLKITVMMEDCSTIVTIE